MLGQRRERWAGQRPVPWLVGSVPRLVRSLVESLVESVVHLRVLLLLASRAKRSKK